MGMESKQRGGVAAGVAHHALRFAGRAGGVEDIERVGGRHRHRVVRGGAGLGGEQVLVAAGDEGGLERRPLQDKAELGLVGALFDRGVEQRLVGHDPAGLEPARGGDDGAGRGVLDALGEFGARQSRRTRRSGSRPAARRRAWRSRPRAPSACRSRPGRRGRRRGRPARRRTWATRSRSGGVGEALGPAAPWRCPRSARPVRRARRRRGGRGSSRSC